MHNGRGFLQLRDDGAAVDFHTVLDSHVYVPFFFCVQGIYLHTAGDIFTGLFGNHGEWTLDTVENIVQDSGAEHNGNSVTCGCYRFPRL